MEPRESFLDEIAARINYLDREIERLKNKIEDIETRPKEREDCMMYLDQLCTCSEALRAKSREIAGAEEGRWEHMRVEVENIWDELKYSVLGSASKFK